MCVCVLCEHKIHLCMHFTLSISKSVDGSSSSCDGNVHNSLSYEHRLFRNLTEFTEQRKKHTHTYNSHDDNNYNIARPRLLYTVCVIHRFWCVFAF